MTPSVYADGVPALKIARNMTNLANHPARGGIPASENRNPDISSASTGAVWPSPEYEAISPERVRRATARGNRDRPTITSPSVSRPATSAPPTAPTARPSPPARHGGGRKPPP